MIRVFILAFAVGLSLVTATNPEYNFPGLVEFFVLGVAFVCLAISRFWSAGSETVVPRWIKILFFGQIIVLLMRYAFGANAEITTHACLRLPAYIPKLECLLQQPAVGAGWRQLFFHFTALNIAIIAYKLQNYSAKRYTTATFLALTPMLVPSLYLICSYYVPISSSFASANFVTGGSSWPIRRGVAIMANPGWVWPLMLPCLATSIGLLMSKSRGAKAVALIYACIFAAAAFASQQRGAYVMIVSMVGIGAAYALATGARSKRTLGLFAVALATVGLGTTYLVATNRLMQIFAAVGQWVRIPVKANATSFDQNRLEMWRLAFGDFKEHAILGHGYLSWSNDFKNLALAAGRADLVFDTAHNFFVQSLFELGVIQAVSIVVGFIAVFLVFWQSASNTWPNIRLTGLLLFSGAFLCLITQELDYINTSYYHFAFFAGLIFGQSQTNPLKVHGTIGRSALMATMALIAGVLCLAISLVIFYQYSWGGYAFELSSLDRNGHYERWFRPRGTITAFPGRDKRIYSVFQIVDNLGFTVPTIYNQTTNFRDFTFSPDSILIESGSKVWGRQINYSYPLTVPIAQRNIAFRLASDPLYTNIGLFGAAGRYRWEGAGEDKNVGVFWCQGVCDLRLKARAVCPHPQLILDAPREDINALHPINITYQVEAVPAEEVNAWMERNITFTGKKSLETTLVAANQVTGQPTVSIENPNNHAKISLPTSGDKSWGWRVKLHVDRTFNPSTLGLSSDSRNLGVRVIDQLCTM